MDMTSTAEASRWYGNQRLPGSPNTALAHQNASASTGGSVDASEMSAYYALENSNAHRRYYSAAASYSPHSEYTTTDEFMHFSIAAFRWQGV